jgi:hypothetical protein
MRQRSCSIQTDICAQTLRSIHSEHWRNVRQISRPLFPYLATRWAESNSRDRETSRTVNYIARLYLCRGIRNFQKLTASVNTKVNFPSRLARLIDFQRSTATLFPMAAVGPIHRFLGRSGLCPCTQISANYAYSDCTRLLSACSFHLSRMYVQPRRLLLAMSLKAAIRRLRQMYADLSLEHRRLKDVLYKDCKAAN